MPRISVHLPDRIPDALRAVAGGRSVSATANALLEQALLVRACAAIEAYEATRDDPEWEAHRPRPWSRPDGEREHAATDISVYAPARARRCKPAGGPVPG